MKEIYRRCLKTVVAIFLVMAIYLLLLLIDKWLGIQDNEWLKLSGFYTPFFSGIAAAYVIQRYAKDAKNSAKKRTVGTLLGGLFGMVLIFIVEYIFLDVVALDINNYDTLIIWKLIEFVIVSICIYPLIYIALKARLNDAIFITCLTYLSVTVSIRNGGMPVIQFAINRILSTLIGIYIALIISHIELILNKNRGLVFVCSFENVHLGNDYDLNDEEVYLINKLYHSGCNLIFTTSMSLCDMGSIFNEIEINKPLICMDGVAIFNQKDNTFSNVITIEKDISKRVINLLNEKFNNVFKYCIYDNKMVCYHNRIESKAERDYLSLGNKNCYFNFVYGDVPDDVDICYLSVIAKECEITEFINNNLDLKDVKISILNYVEPEYKILSIYNKNVDRYNSIQKLSLTDKLVVLSSSCNDSNLIKNSYFSMCFNNSEDEVIKSVNYVINSNSLQDGLKVINKLYYSTNYKKTINHYKKK